MQSASDLKRPPRLTMVQQQDPDEQENKYHDILNYQSMLKSDMAPPDMQAFIHESIFSNNMKASHLIQSQYSKFNNSINCFVQPQEMNLIQNKQITFLQSEILGYLRLEVRKEIMIGQIIEAITKLCDNFTSDKFDLIERKLICEMLNLLKSELLKEHETDNIILDSKFRSEYDQETCHIIQLLENILLSLKIPQKVTTRGDIWGQDDGPYLKQSKESLYFEQPESLINSIKFDNCESPEIQQTDRQKKVKRYREKKANQLRPFQYQTRKNIAENRLRIKGRFISKTEQLHLAEMLPEKDIFNKNNNLNIEVKFKINQFVSKKLNVMKTYNDIGYGTIRKEDILQQVELLIKRKQLQTSYDKVLMSNIRKKHKIFYIVSGNQSI